MAAATLALSKNVVSAKRLIGIANFVRVSSEATFLSSGTSILSTEQEIRDTKKAQVLLPLMVDTLDVKDVLTQAKAGGVHLTEAELNEFIVELANEKITKPQIWRPRDGETISANGLFDRFKSSYEISAVVSKDKSYYENIKYQAVKGVPVAKGIAAAAKLLKGKVVDSQLKTATVKDKAFEFANIVRHEIADLMIVKDKMTQQYFTKSDFAIVVPALMNIHLENDVRYNMYTEKVQSANGILTGNFDGVDVLVSKRLPAGVNGIIMLKGAAVSVFALRNKMNNDKVVGVEAYAASLEFDEGTGVFIPHMITILSDATAPAAITAQDRVTFDDLTLAMSLSETTSGNDKGSDGLA